MDSHARGKPSEQRARDFPLHAVSPSVRLRLLFQPLLVEIPEANQSKRAVEKKEPVVTDAQQADVKVGEREAMCEAEQPNGNQHTRFSELVTAVEKSGGRVPRLTKILNAGEEPAALTLAGGYCRHSPKNVEI